VFGMCNPLYDIQAEISEELLREAGFQKGGMFLIEAEQQESLVGISRRTSSTRPRAAPARTR